MEANLKKFVCKFCNKRFQCGKSLGGHIRIHFNGNSTTTTSAFEEESDYKLKFVSDSDTKVINGGQFQYSGYGLRENPKKTTRFAPNTSNSNDLVKVCRECGKGFQSMKALCGHMACHSKTSTTSFEDFSGTSGGDQKLKELLVMDSESDTETCSAPSKRRRSKRIRYKKIGVQSCSLHMVNNNDSCSASDFEQEQEEVAMSLMMLSRDSGFKGCFSSIAYSSDNNSVVLEDKSSLRKIRIRTENGGDCEYNGDGELMEMEKEQEKEVVVSVEKDHSGNSDSGYFNDGSERLEYETSYPGFAGNNGFKKQKLESGSSFDEEFDHELGKRLSRFRRIKTNRGKDVVEDYASDQEDIASMKRNSSKIQFCDHKTHSSNAQKGSKFFSKSTKAGFTDENSIDNGNRKLQYCEKSSMVQNYSKKAEKKPVSRKGKVHECPFCTKVFKSGQALGGHKRSHFVGGGSEERTIVIKQVEQPSLIDLNLPAPVEEESDWIHSKW